MRNRITSFFIEKFKSLNEFRIDFSERSNVLVLVGCNGSGKTSVLQCLDFIGEIFRGDVDKWLTERGWSPTDIIYPSKKRSIELSLSGVFDNHKVTWTATYNLSTKSCTAEEIKVDDITRIIYSKNVLHIDKEIYEIIYDYTGSIFSKLKYDKIKDQILISFINYSKGIYSFDTLNSTQLLSKSRKKIGGIGRGGQHVAGVFSALSDQQKKNIISNINKIFPWLSSIQAIQKRAGWIELNFEETAGQRYFSIPAKHSCDGLLRILAFITEINTSDTLVVFDEIENGLNPEIMKSFLECLFDSNKQIVFTTHNPVILNYIKEEIAEEIVYFMFRDDTGKSSATRFFSIPSVKEKLEWLGPGEAFLDVNHMDLVNEIHNRTREK
ncbi:MAG: AAA family ATPase [Desulfovibrio sp.]|nr:AAA family ATPase [Desulfovibrio sp.]